MRSKKIQGQALFDIEKKSVGHGLRARENGKRSPTKKISPKGKRKLSFQPKQPSLLTGKKFFLDIQGCSKMDAIKHKILQLGGTVEEFNSKDVYCTVTNRVSIDEIISYRSQHKQSTSSPYSCGALPSPQCAPAPSPLQQIYANKGVINSPLSTDSPQTPQSLDQRGLNITRGKSLLNKAVSSTQKQGSSNLLQLAQKWGTKVLHLEHFIKWTKEKKVVECLLQAQKGSGSKTSSASSHHTKSTQFKVKHLKTPFIKVESLTRKYRPFYIELEEWPAIYFESVCGTCPFEKPKERRASAESQEQVSDKETNKDDSAQPISENATGKREEKSERKEVREEEKVPEEKRTLRNVAPEDGKGGYCECCCVRFNDLSKHLKSDQHRSFARNDYNYAGVDAIIHGGETFQNYLESIRMKHENEGRGGAILESFNATENIEDNGEYLKESGTRCFCEVGRCAGECKEDLRMDYIEKQQADVNCVGGGNATSLIGANQSQQNSIACDQMQCNERSQQPRVKADAIPSDLAGNVTTESKGLCDQKGPCADESTCHQSEHQFQQDTSLIEYAMGHDEGHPQEKQWCKQREGDIPVCQVLNRAKHAIVATNEGRQCEKAVNLKTDEEAKQDVGAAKSRKDIDIVNNCASAVGCEDFACIEECKATGRGSIEFEDKANCVVDCVDDAAKCTEERVNRDDSSCQWKNMNGSCEDKNASDSSRQVEYTASRNTLDDGFVRTDQYFQSTREMKDEAEKEKSQCEMCESKENALNDEETKKPGLKNKRENSGFESENDSSLMATHPSSLDVNKAIHSQLKGCMQNRFCQDEIRRAVSQSEYKDPCAYRVHLDNHIEAKTKAKSSGSKECTVDFPHIESSHDGDCDASKFSKDRINSERSNHNMTRRSTRKLSSRSSLSKEDVKDCTKKQNVQNVVKIRRCSGKRYEIVPNSDACHARSRSGQEKSSNQSFLKQDCEMASCEKDAELGTRCSDNEDQIAESGKQNKAKLGMQKIHKEKARKRASSGPAINPNSDAITKYSKGKEVVNRRPGDDNECTGWSLTVEREGGNPKRRRGRRRKNTPGPTLPMNANVIEISRKLHGQIENAINDQKVTLGKSNSDISKELVSHNVAFGEDEGSRSSDASTETCWKSVDNKPFLPGKLEESFSGSSTPELEDGDGSVRSTSATIGDDTSREVELSRGCLRNPDKREIVDKENCFARDDVSAVCNRIDMGASDDDLGKVVRASDTNYEKSVSAIDVGIALCDVHEMSIGSKSCTEGSIGLFDGQPKNAENQKDMHGHLIRNIEAKNDRQRNCCIKRDSNRRSSVTCPPNLTNDEEDRNCDEGSTDRRTNERSNLIGGYAKCIEQVASTPKISSTFIESVNISSNVNAPSTVDCQPISPIQDNFPCSPASKSRREFVAGRESPEKGFVFSSPSSNAEFVSKIDDLISELTMSVEQKFKRRRAKESDESFSRICKKALNLASVGDCTASSDSTDASCDTVVFRDELGDRGTETRQTDVFKVEKQSHGFSDAEPNPCATGKETSVAGPMNSSTVLKNQSTEKEKAKKRGRNELSPDVSESCRSKRSCTDDSSDEDEHTSVEKSSLLCNLSLKNLLQTNLKESQLADDVFTFLDDDFKKGVTMHERVKMRRRTASSSNAPSHGFTYASQSHGELTPTKQQFGEYVKKREQTRNENTSEERRRGLSAEECPLSDISARPTLTRKHQLSSTPCSNKHHGCADLSRNTDDCVGKPVKGMKRSKSDDLSSQHVDDNRIATSKRLSNDPVYVLSDETATEFNDTKEESLRRTPDKSLSRRLTNGSFLDSCDESMSRSVLQSVSSALRSRRNCASRSIQSSKNVLVQKSSKKLLTSKHMSHNIYDKDPYDFVEF